MLSLITRQLWSVVTYEVLVFLENISVLESYFWNFNELFLGHRHLTANLTLVLTGLV